MKRIKINDTEDAILGPDGGLQIDGASYIAGMSSYEWFFQIEREHLVNLYKKISNDDVSDDVGNSMIDFLKKNQIKVSDLLEVCKENDIEHYFTTYR